MRYDMKEYSWNHERILNREQDVYLEADFDQEVTLSNLTVALQPFVGHEQDFHSPEFQSDVAQVISRVIPESTSFSQEAKERTLTDLRFCIVRGLGFNSLPDPIRDLYILGFSAQMGVATPTDQVKKKVLWPVQEDMSPIVKNLTFSQTLGEAAYHTDTQYFKDPEEMFGLWCVQPDRNGDGLSGLVDGRYIVQELAQTEEGRQILNIFMHTEFPFRVPSVFTAGASDETIEVFMAPILAQKPFIRYRRETLDKGVHATGNSLTPEQRSAVDHLDQQVLDKNISYSFLLQKGEVAFANNHELLHSRSNFQDPARHLIRVRMNRHDNDWETTE
jgi:alpha-ketoglutarate-dependent taurine dioxygenase